MSTKLGAIQSIDRKALEPVAPIKPKKALITLLGLVLGALFGILIVIAKYFVAQRRDGLQQPLSVQSRRDPTETTGAGNLLQKDLR